MSYRDNKPQIVEFQTHQRIFSYNGTKEIKNLYEIDSSSSSSSSTPQEWNQKSEDKINFNSGQAFRNLKDSPDSSSRISSDNQTQNFIRAQFNKNQAKYQLLYPPNGSKKNGQSKSIDNFFNQNTTKQQNTKKQVYETTFFEVQIEDKEDEQAKKLKGQRPTQIQNVKQTKDFILLPKTTSKDFKQPTKPQQHHTHRYSELEQIETIIMRTLKQKQSQIQILHQQLKTLNDEKLFYFKINQQMQNDLKQVKKKSMKAERIRSSNGEESFSQINITEWKPQNAEQMKLMIQNEQLVEEYKKLEDEEQSLVKMKQQIAEEQAVLRQSLKCAFKTRKQYAKGIVSQDDFSKERNQKQQSRVINEAKTQAFRHATSKVTQKSRPKQKQTQRFRNQSVNTKLQSETIKTIAKNKRQLNSMNQKQILLKLMKDFNQLKNKVDQSLIVNEERRSKTKSSISTQNKRKRRVVY